nr:MAG TPA: hypothetical protein [Microviridae sp.]
MTKIETMSALTGALASGVIGMISNAISQTKADKYNKEYMGLQAHYNEQAADRNQQRQKDMWNYTNAENQKQHLINAGLNPALMYGQQGAGGVGQTGNTNEQGVQAPTGNPVMMGLQAESIAQDIALKAAMAKKAEAEANKTAGVDTELTQKQIQSEQRRFENMLKEGYLMEAKQSLFRQQKWTEEALQHYYEQEEATSWQKGNNLAMENQVLTQQWKSWVEKAKQEGIKTWEMEQTKEIYVKNQAAILSLNLAMEMKEKNLAKLSIQQVKNLQEEILKIKSEAKKNKMTTETYPKYVQGQIDYWLEQNNIKKWELGIKEYDNICNRIIDVIKIVIP